MGHVRDLLPEKADRTRGRERVKEEIDLKKFQLIGKESLSKELISIEEIYGELNNSISIDKMLLHTFANIFCMKIESLHNFDDPLDFMIQASNSSSFAS